MRVEVVFKIEEVVFSGRKHWLDTAFRHRISGRQGTDECTEKLLLFGLLASCPSSIRSISMSRFDVPNFSIMSW